MDATQNSTRETTQAQEARQAQARAAQVAREDDDDAPPACDCTDVAAYLDGELSVAESSSFEQHLASCRSCAASLAEQRRLLCLLDAAFSRAQRKVALPEDFVRVVKARAQTDMTSVRHSSEKRRALVLCLALAALSCALLGTRALGEGLAPLRAAAGAALSISDMVFHTLAEACAGALVVLRGFGRHLVTEPRGASAFAFAALACAFVALLRLVGDYHRQRLPD
jgi:anti-sigma factor RsiW